jgi:serine phosphatase RsbU (regulator of sigma subunit)
MERGGLPLGMFRDTRYYEYYQPIEPGQLLVLYTDGATEANGANGEEYGRARLEAAVRASRHMSARDLITAIQQDVLAWTDGRGASDDMTFFIVKAL